MTLGRYMLVDRIGEGGMAEVYTAVSFGYGGFRRPFVIKRLRAELNGNPTAVGLFIDEANLASTLVHPNIVPVFDFGEAAGSYFLSQEYVIGRDLGQVTRRLRERNEPLLSVGAILQLAHEVLAGLEYAHGKRDEAGNPLGIVHRDITPENVMISERGEVKVLDFGIMKAEAARVADRERHGEGERRVHVPGAGARQDASTSARICSRWAWSSSTRRPASRPIRARPSTTC